MIWVDRRTTRKWVGGERVMTQNPFTLVCAKPPHHVRVKIHRVWRRAESILCNERGPNPLMLPLNIRLDLRALLSAVAMQAAIDGTTIKTCIRCPSWQCLEWLGGRIAGGCTTGAAHVVGRVW